MNRNLLTFFSCSTVLLALSGCHEADPSSVVTPPDTPPSMNLTGRVFTGLVQNNTAGQPISPPLVLTHDNGYQLFQFGMQASVPLEHLAEGGDNQPLIGTVADNGALFSYAVGTGVIAPGAQQSVMFMLTEPNSTHVTMAGMLVNTNDAFFAEKMDISDLAVGQSLTVQAPIWDSGTEQNTETALTIPGPAGNGVGFAPQRNDVNRITTHRGVISNQDGLVGSALNGTHRFLNPPVTITVSRVK